MSLLSLRIASDESPRSPGRAAFLEALALTGDIVSYGEVTDRLDRDGVAFAATRVMDDDGQAYTDDIIVVIDPTTGAVLEIDMVYPNDLPGAPSVVEAYYLVVEATYTTTLPACGHAACPTE